MHHQQLLNQYPIISDQIDRRALEVVLRELERTLTANVPGAVVEFGCYLGTTSLFMRRVLNEYAAERSFQVYDSFEGLPTKSMFDASAAGTDFKAGELRVSKRELLRQFKRAKLAPPIVRKGWFSDLNAQDIPSQLAFAFLDGDFYESILQSLRLCWPRLSPGGTVAIDDYQRETLPGVARAVRDFFGPEPDDLHLEHNIAVIRKQSV